MIDTNAGDSGDAHSKDEKEDKAKSRLEIWSEALKTIAGLVAVIVAAVLVTIIATAAISKNSQTALTVATATTGIIGSIAGAYLGMKISGDRTEKANTAHREEAAKAQVYALHIPDGKAETVQREAAAAAKEARKEK